MHVLETTEALIHNPLALVLVQSPFAEYNFLQVRAHEPRDDVPDVGRRGERWATMLTTTTHTTQHTQRWWTVAVTVRTVAGSTYTSSNESIEAGVPRLHSNSMFS